MRLGYTKYYQIQGHFKLGTYCDTDVPRKTVIAGEKSRLKLERLTKLAILWLKNSLGFIYHGARIFMTLQLFLVAFV